MKPSDDKSREELRKSILGFGERSMKKSYYAQLQKTQEELERYRSLIEESSEAVCILEVESYNFLDANGGAATIFGISCERLLEKSFLDLIPSDEKSEIKNWWERDKDSRLIREMTISEGGKNLTVSYSLKCGAYRDSRYLTLIAQDVTKLHSIQEKLHQSDKLLAIGQLAGGIAHDFNNQLAGIVGFAEMVKLDSQAGSDLSSYADHILGCAHQSALLTGKLLTFARKRSKTKKSVDIHTVILEVQALLSHSIDKRISISSDLSSEISIIAGDGSQIQNALLNLGVNARDAMTEGGELVYSTRLTHVTQDFLSKYSDAVPDGEYIRVSVSDTGAGISEEVQKKIFDPFFTTKGEGEGTGLGLSAVYGTVKDHDGFITTYSEVGMGTTFNIYLPVSSEIQTSRPRNFSDDIAMGSGTILIVDDEPEIINVAKGILEHNGYTVITACDGEAALVKFRENKDKINLIIMDMIMPNLNGLETLTRIRASGSAVPVLISSGYAHNGEIDQALLKEKVTFIQKPFFRDDLLMSVIRDIRNESLGNINL